MNPIPIAPFIGILGAWAAVANPDLIIHSARRVRPDRTIDNLITFPYSGLGTGIHLSEDVRDFTIRHMHFHCFSCPGIENRSHYNVWRIYARLAETF